MQYLMHKKVQIVQHRIIIFDAPTGQNAGQAVTTSGGVAGTTGQAMETLSPFMSLNYIIYTGKV